MPIIGALEATANGQFGIERWSFTSADTWEAITVPGWAQTAVFRVYDSVDPAVTTTNYTLYVGVGDTAGAVGANDAWVPVSSNGNLVMDLALSFRGGRGAAEGGRPEIRLAVSSTSAEVAIVWEGNKR